MRIGTYYRAEYLKYKNAKCKEDSVILDLGGYDGYWASLQPTDKKHVADVDILEKYPSIVYKKIEGSQLPYADAFFDYVYCLDVLEHVKIEDEDKLVSEIFRVLKPEGKLLITVPSNNIKLFPPFMTKWISKRWGHEKCIGYSTEQLSKFGGIIIANTARAYLNLYLGLKLIWPLSKPLVKLAAKIDASSKNKTDVGYWLVLK